MASITLEHIEKVYGETTHVIHDLNLSVADGEFLVLVGPSGCGKSTALRMVAGLEEITGGTLRIGNRVVNTVDPKDRDIAMVFQSYALYPHMTVYQNIGFPLEMLGVPKAEADKRIRDAASTLELTQYLDRKPAQLSGGQRQRVAMGRAIVRKPSAFLMDEPLSNLDAKLRVQMRAEIARLQKQLGVTTIYVTHDQVEAMTMGDRVAVLKGGQLQQVDTPKTLYDRPANVFVGAFIGSPSMNILRGSVTTDQLTLGQQIITLSEALFVKRPGLRNSSNRPVIVGIRPEDLEDARLSRPGSATIDAEVLLVESLGAELIVHFVTDAQSDASGDPDAIVAIGGRSTCVGRFLPQSQIKAGETAKIAVAVGNIHIFDPESRNSIW